MHSRNARNKQIPQRENECSSEHWALATQLLASGVAMGWPQAMTMASVLTCNASEQIKHFLLSAAHHFGPDFDIDDLKAEEIRRLWIDFHACRAPFGGIPSVGSA